MCTLGCRLALSLCRRRLELGIEQNYFQLTTSLVGDNCGLIYEDQPFWLVPRTPMSVLLERFTGLFEKCANSNGIGMLEKAFKVPEI